MKNLLLKIFNAKYAIQLEFFNCKNTSRYTQVEAGMILTGKLKVITNNNYGKAANEMNKKLVKRKKQESYNILKNTLYSD